MKFNAITLKTSAGYVTSTMADNKVKKMLLVGRFKKLEVSIDYPIIKEDITTHSEKIIMGTTIFGLIHPDEVRNLIANNVKATDTILSYAVDGIIDMINLVPALLSELDKWFGVYIYSLFLAINEMEV